MKEQEIKPNLPTIRPWAVMILLLVIYHLIYRNFYPGPAGIGHDYSYVFPMLLDNYRWFINNGWSVPWFTPGFCGGQPIFPDPQSMYYSLPQFLALYTDPLSAVYLNMLVFSGAGLSGMYLLLRHVFRCSPATALLGAGLFAFNGFFAYRMLVGHLPFHGVMLAPWLALALLWSPDSPRHAGPARLMAGVLGGAVLAYWVNAGMATMLPPTLIAVAGLMAIHGITGGSWRGFGYRLLLAGIIGLGLSLSKISAVFAFMDNMPRTGYLLPGMDSVWQTVRLAATSLFLSPPDIAQVAKEHMANVQWFMDRHELEYGMTMVPVIIALLVLASWCWRASRGAMKFTMIAPARLGWMLLLGVVLTVPIAVNTYTPAWNAILKQLPFIGSASNLFRWFYIYVPLVAVATAVLLERAPLPQPLRTGLALSALAAALALHIATDQQYYKNQPYQPATIVSAYDEARASHKAKPISGIAVHRNQQGQILMPIFRNDMVAEGLSQLACYNPVFGYRLEHFPVKTLHPGPLAEISDGRYNLKDPACYVFPAENACAPGDHFTVSRRDDAKRFSEYQPYFFIRSQRQIWADRVTGITLYVVPLLLMGGIVWWWKSKVSIRPDGGDKIT